MFFTTIILWIFGLIASLTFAPVFFTAGIFSFSVLFRYVSSAKNWQEAFKYGYIYGFGFFLGGLYWISFALQVFIDEFWWAIPFALLGLPLFIAIFVAIAAACAWCFRQKLYYHFIFCLIWLVMEWFISWLFTGLPWSMVGYSLSASDILLQSASMFSIFGLSFIVIYIGSSLYEFKNALRTLTRILTSATLIIVMILYGTHRLDNNKTEFSSIKARIVQPSIPQSAKWDPKIFWQNLDLHVKLSKQEGNPDIIFWSEAALTAPHYHKPIQKTLLKAMNSDNQTLIFGGVNDNRKTNEDLQIYSSLLAINNQGHILFDYHKSHLVPFGEYMPLKNLLPLKKITHGILDYSEGDREIVYLSKHDLKILPLICYESIFPLEITISNDLADVMVNVTNDSWYGNSSGPYQHFEISRMRAVENGLPMIRAGNNGISAIIDPYGRVIKKLNLNDIGILDSHIPVKQKEATMFSIYKHLSVFVLIILVLILQLIFTIVGHIALFKLKKP